MSDLPDVSPAVEPPVVVPVCLNCEAERSGPYCHACGQRHAGDRLTFSELWKDVAAQILKLERGLLLTMRDLLRNPGGTSLAYVRGKRQRYTNPLSVFLLTSAVSLVLYARQTDELRRLLRDGTATFAFFTPAQKARYPEIVMASIEVSYAYQIIVFVVAIALSWRLFFRRSGFTVAELLVPALYGVSVYQLCNVVMMALDLLRLTSIPTGVEILLGYLIGSMLFAWVAAGVFPGRRWASALKGAFGFVTAFLLFAILRDGLLVSYVLLTVPE